MLICKVLTLAVKIVGDKMFKSGVLCLFIIMISGCYNYSNPVHPGGDSFQGFLTVTSVEEFAPAFPEDGSIELSAPEQIVCTELIGAETYHAQISVDSDYTNCIYDKADNSTNIFDISNIIFEVGTFYIRFRVKYEGQWSNWTNSVSFSVTIDIVPSDRGTTFDTTALLNWNNISSAMSYEIRYAGLKDDVLNADIYMTSISEYQIPLEDVFEFGESCYWQVRIVNSDFLRETWSKIYKFTITDISTWSGIILSANKNIANTTPILDWDDIPGITDYEIQYDTIDGSTGSIIRVTSSDYLIPFDLAVGNTVYWRVRIVNQDEIRGIWSNIWSFVISEPLIPIIPDIPGGSFLMGSESGDEAPEHTVNFTRSFNISTAEITQKQYTDITGKSNPAAGFGIGDNYPVYNVSWYDAIAFCNMLSEEEGFVPSYYSDSSFSTVYNSGTEVYCNWSVNGYRLPTEAEWEYSALGGASSNGYDYSGSNTIGDVTWYSVNAGSITHEIGEKSANELLIYDMSGNLEEWCWDWYGAYSDDIQTDPVGPSSGPGRISRGGSWDSSADSCRVTSRDSYDPVLSANTIGFRIFQTH